MEVGNGDNEGWIPDQVGNDNGGYTAGKETYLNNSLSLQRRENYYPDFGILDLRFVSDFDIRI